MDGIWRVPGFWLRTPIYYHPTIYWGCRQTFLCWWLKPQDGCDPRQIGRMWPEPWFCSADSAFRAFRRGWGCGPKSPSPQMSSKVCPRVSRWNQKWIDPVVNQLHWGIYHPSRPGITQTILMLWFDRSFWEWIIKTNYFTGRDRDLKLGDNWSLWVPRNLLCGPEFDPNLLFKAKTSCIDLRRHSPMLFGCSFCISPRVHDTWPILWKQYQDTSGAFAKAHMRGSSPIAYCGGDQHP